jgi:hypothetical protein
MIKKITTLVLTLAALGMGLPAHAEDTTCYVEVALSSSIDYSQNVSFNVNNDQGTSRSSTLSGGSAPHRIDNIPCSDTPYLVSATAYNTQSNSFALFGPIGECTLKYDGGQIYLRSHGSNVSVVFPNDFICK